MHPAMNGHHYATNDDNFINNASIERACVYMTKWSSNTRCISIVVIQSNLEQNERSTSPKMARIVSNSRKTAENSSFFFKF